MFYTQTKKGNAILLKLFFLYHLRSPSKVIVTKWTDKLYIHILL